MTYFKLFILGLGIVGCSFSGTTPPDSPQPQTTDSAFITEGSTGRFNGEYKVDAATGTVTVGFAAQVPLLDPLTGMGVPAQPFDVVLATSPQWPEREAGTVVVSGINGEIRYQGQLTYSDLNPESYLHRYLLIRSRGPLHTGSITVVPVHINPWQRGELFYRDDKRDGQPEYAARSEQRSELVLPPTFTTAFLGRDFHIDDHLQLTALRRYSVVLNPSLIRPNAQGDYRPGALRPGTRFRLQVLLLDPKDNRAPLNGFLAGWEGEVVTGRQGEILANFTLGVGFADEPRLDSRTRLHLELTPIGNSELGPLPVQLETTFTANPLQDTSANQQVTSETAAATRTMPASYTTAMATPEGASFVVRTRWEQTPLQLYARFWSGYGPLVTLADGTLPDETWKPWTDARLPPTVQDPLLKALSSKTVNATALLTPFCAKLVKVDQPLCKQRPETFFHFSQFDVVEKALQPTPRIVADRRSQISLAASYFNEAQISNRTLEGDKELLQHIHGSSSKAGYELWANGSTVYKSFNINEETYASVEVAVGDSQRSRVSIDERLPLIKEEIKLGFKVALRHCAVIRPLRFSRGPHPLDTFLLCSRSEQKETTESWFSIRDRFSLPASFGDPRNPEERGWSKLVRGWERFQVFSKALSDPTRQYAFVRITPFLDALDTLGAGAFYSEPEQERLTRDGGIFPGVLDYRENTQLQWSQSQLQQLTTTCEESFSGQSDTVKARGKHFCRCTYETAARRWPFEAYIENVTTYNALLKAEGTDDRCLAYAREEQP